VPVGSLISQLVEVEPCNIRFISGIEKAIQLETEHRQNDDENCAVADSLLEVRKIQKSKHHCTFAAKS
jgi:hypothetical protein